MTPRDTATAVYRRQRAYHRDWLTTEAIHLGAYLLATDPNTGAARAVQVLAQYAHRIAALTEPEERAA